MESNDTYEIDFSQRNPEKQTDPLFYKRWSPRSFKQESISPDTATCIMDAARWAPSCFNEQPWLIVTSTAGENDFNDFLDLLIDKNREWARNACMLGFIFARKNFSSGGKPNRWSFFDCGAAWMNLTLQARKLGLYTHGMGGIKRKKACQALNVSEEEYDVVCGFAVGALDTPDKLPQENREREIPSPRKSLSEIWRQGKQPVVHSP